MLRKILIGPIGFMAVIVQAVVWVVTPCDLIGEY
jgi:hypothetical protein